MLGRHGKPVFKPLPFKLGTNGGMLAFTVDTPGIAAAQDIGMKIYRNDLPWTFTKGVFSGIESTPGTYNATNINTLVSLTATLKAAGLTPLYLMESNQSPVLCPMLTTALTNGQAGVTSISVTKLPYAIAIGDSLVLTTPDQAHTQTVVAQSVLAKGASGAVTVTSFTSNAAYPGFVASTTSPVALGTEGAWVYDTAWPACTPQHLANTMAMLVATPGLQGLHWELFNEPDGVAWGTDAMLVTRAYKLAYPAMKAADPTCVVHGVCIENMAPIGFPEGTAYYQLCVLAGIVGNYDVLSIHQYSNDPNGNLDEPPDGPNIWGAPYWQMLANFQQQKLARGDTAPIWLTEVGFQSGQRTSIAAGSNGVDVTTFAGAGVLSVASSSSFTSGTALVATSVGQAKVTYTGVGTGTLTGCTYAGGDTGTLATGGEVIGLVNGNMTPQLQAQYYQNLLLALSGRDPVNNVQFSSYLAALLIFTQTGSFQNWSIIDPTFGDKPAYGVLKHLVAGG